MRDKGALCVEVDVKIARQAGCIFRQNQSFSIMTSQITPRESIIRMWNIKTGAVEWERGKHAYPLPHLKPRSEIPPAGGDAEHFHYDDDQVTDQDKQKALKRREGIEHESSSEEEHKGQGASSSKDHQMDIVKPQTLVSGKRYPDEAHLRFIKCSICFSDNIIGNVNCDQCGHILVSNEQSSKNQDQHIEESQVTHTLEIAVRTKPRGDYVISEAKKGHRNI